MLGSLCLLYLVQNLERGHTASRHQPELVSLLDEWDVRFNRQLAHVVAFHTPTMNHG